MQATDPLLVSRGICLLPHRFRFDTEVFLDANTLTDVFFTSKRGRGGGGGGGILIFETLHIGLPDLVLLAQAEPIIFAASFT